MWLSRRKTGCARRPSWLDCAMGAQTTYNQIMAMIDCRHFSGYKPCSRNDTCDSNCPHFSIGLPRILIIHLEALGAVLRATCILPAIKMKFPRSHITWVTKAPAQHLLANNPLLDRVLTTHGDDLLALSAL